MPHLSGIMRPPWPRSRKNEFLEPLNQVKPWQFSPFVPKLSSGAMIAQVSLKNPSFRPSSLMSSLHTRQMPIVSPIPRKSRISYFPIYPSECALCLSQFSKYSPASSLVRILKIFSALLSSAGRVKLKLPVITTARSLIITYYMDLLRNRNDYCFQPKWNM